MVVNHQYMHELAIQNSHCNNGSLGLSYLITLPRPNYLELFFPQNLVAEVPDSEKLICTKSGISATKFCEKSSRSLGSGKVVK